MVVVVGILEVGLHAQGLLLGPTLLTIAHFLMIALKFITPGPFYYVETC